MPQHSSEIFALTYDTLYINVTTYVSNFIMSAISPKHLETKEEHICALLGKIFSPLETQLLIIKKLTLYEIFSINEYTPVHMYQVLSVSI